MFRITRAKALWECTVKNVQRTQDVRRSAEGSLITEMKVRKHEWVNGEGENTHSQSSSTTLIEADSCNGS